MVKTKYTAGLVTIDVEPDNVWANTQSKSLKNIDHLPRFHNLCMKYGVRPTYFVSWFVANDNHSSKIIEKLLRQGNCEIGIHPHLWETPPIAEKDNSDIAWVGPDYTSEIIEAKLTSLTNLITDRFGAPKSHRAGRWGLDIRQVKILTNLGICVDSSVIPGVNWSKTRILDYTKAPMYPYYIDKKDICKAGDSDLLEVPCTIKPGLRIFGLENTRYLLAILKRLSLTNMWLRPSPHYSINNILRTCSWASKRLPHLNLMSHSSEFIAGGSPYWPKDTDVVKHFNLYRQVFTWWNSNGIVPKTLSEFASVYVKNNKVDYK